MDLDRSTGDSARALLLTVLGELVLPGGGRVWTSTIIGAFGILGVEEKSARQALARTADRGWLEGERIGRRTRWALTDRGVRMLTEGTERIYGFGRHHEPWDGQWVLVFVSVPETRRRLRYRLRIGFGWAGFGPLGPGAWISPRVDREAEAKDVLGELGLDDGASFVGSFGSIGEPVELVREAWDLLAVEDAYRSFIAEHGKRRPRSAEQAFVALVRLVHDWRRFPLLDPDLPRALLPPDWMGARAAELFHTRHDAWKPQAIGWWDERSGR